MPKFSPISQERLATCHVLLQNLFNAVIRTYDCSILEGHRGQEDQHKYWLIGRSKVDWPNSKHNSLPSRAVDVAPWPINWEDKLRWYHFAGFVLAKAESMGINVRWGGDWNGNMKFRDQKFNDLPHWELKGE